MARWSGPGYRRTSPRAAPYRSSPARAVAHSVLSIIYVLLTRESPYTDLGPAYFDERDRNHTTKRLVARLQRLGYCVNLELHAATG